MKTLKYCPELNTFTGSITASLLLCQLEYWFSKRDSKPFYKFLSPCEDEHYHKGDSWTEELGFTKAEFRTAFRRIGTVYKSKSEFLKSKDPFGDKLYLSYYDRIKKLTYYMRHDKKVEELLESQHCASPYSVDYPSSKIPQQQSTCLGSSTLIATAPLTPTASPIATSTLPYNHILALFHKYCPSLNPITGLTSKCKQQLDKLSKRIQSKGLDLIPSFQKAFTLVESSDFLCGKSNSTFKAAFGWIIRSDKFFAILEGAYQPFPEAHIKSSSKPPSTFMRMYTHGFDLEALQAREDAYIQELYGQP